MWFIAQMYRWGQLEVPVDIAKIARSVYLSEIYREVAAELGIDVPTVDTKVEGLHAQPWKLTAATRPIDMGADRYMDDRTFHPNHIIDYLTGFQVHGLKLPAQDLLAANSE
jgi:nitrate/nitrite transport system substrate-binding protein